MGRPTKPDFSTLVGGRTIGDMIESSKIIDKKDRHQLVARP